MSFWEKIGNKFKGVAFIEACKSGNRLDVISMLNSDYKLIDYKDSRGMSGLFYALGYEHNQIAEFLLKLTRHIDDRDFEKGFTLLSIASTNGNQGLVSLLLERGANPNLSRFDGITPLHNAIYEGHTEIIRMLLEHGADPNLKDRMGNSAFDLADMIGNTEFRKVFNDQMWKEKLDSPKDLAEYLFKFYSNCKTNFSSFDFDDKEIFQIMLPKITSISGISKEDADEILSYSNNIIAFTLEIIGHENYMKSMLKDFREIKKEVLLHFEKNAPEEYKRFLEE